LWLRLPRFYSQKWTRGDRQAISKPIPKSQKERGVEVNESNMQYAPYLRQTWGEKRKSERVTEALKFLGGDDKRKQKSINEDGRGGPENGLRIL